MRTLRLPAGAITDAWVVGLVLLAYLPLLVVPFATSDDYKFLLNALEGRSTFALIGGDGRALLALLDDAGYSLTASIDDLWRMRLLFVLLMALLTVVLRRTLCAAGWSSLGAAAVSLAFAASVPGLDLVSYSACFATPLAALLAAAAAHLLVGGIEAKSRGQPPAIGRLGMAFALLVVAFAIYQPAVFLFWVFLAARWFTKTAEPLVCARRLTLAGCVFVPAMLVYYGLFFRLVPGLLGIPLTQRAQASAEPLKKAAWFLAMPLRDALRLFVIPDGDVVQQARQRAGGAEGALLEPGSLVMELLGDPTSWLAGLVFLVLCAGLWRALSGPGGRASWRARLGMTTLALALLPLSHLLSLYVATLWSPPRTQLALFGMLLFLLGTAVRGLSASLPVPRAARRAALVGFALVSLLAFQRNALVYVVLPRHLEWSHLVATLRALPPTPSVAIRPALHEDHLGPPPHYELGRPASSVAWGPRPMIAHGVKKAGWPMQPAVRVLQPEEEPRAGELLVDLRTLRYLR